MKDRMKRGLMSAGGGAGTSLTTWLRKKKPTDDGKSRESSQQPNGELASPGSVTSYDA